MLWHQPLCLLRKQLPLLSVQGWTEEALENLAAACSAACNPIDDKRGTVEYRVRVAGVLAKRAANIAFQRAGGKMTGVHVSTSINGDPVEYVCPADESLLDVLRTE